MKKMNKKGFTLAELLIVIAIIAVLIAIAIPTFSGALDNAKRQTDHANIRSAYSVTQIAKLTGTLGQDETAESKPVDSSGNLVDTKWVMQKDGSFKKTGVTGATYANYELKAKGDSASCGGCAGCVQANHEVGREIYIVYKAASGSTAESWTLVLNEGAPS